MLRGHSPTATQEYAEKRTFYSRRLILEREAKVHLVEPYLSTFLSVVDMISELAVKRHAFAHHVWGNVEALPDAVLLVDPKHLFLRWGAANDWVAAFAADPSSVVRRSTMSAGTDTKFNADLVEVWTKDDLMIEIAGVVKAYELSVALEAISSLDVFDDSQNRRDFAYNELLKDTVVAAKIAGSASGSP